MSKAAVLVVPDARPPPPRYLGPTEARVFGAMLDAHPAWRDGPQSHAFMSGACYDDARKPVHMGTLGVPVEDQVQFDALYAETVVTPLMGKYSLSELRTPLFALFVDFDLESPVSAEFIQFVLELCKSTNVGELDLAATRELAGLVDFARFKHECEWLLQQRHGTASVVDHGWIKMLEALVHVTQSGNEMHTMHNESTVVSTIYTQPADERLSGLNGVPEVIYWLFCAALTKLVQDVVRAEFVEDLAACDRLLTAMGLLSRSSDRGTIQLPRAELHASGVVVYKWGVHVHCPGLIVSPELALSIRVALRRRIDQIDVDPPGGGLWRASGFVDDAPYIGQTGGIRKPFCVKTLRCTCSRRGGGPVCSRCAGTGKLISPFVYGSGCLFAGSGDMVSGRRLEMLHRSPRYVVSLASIRVPDTTTSAGLKVPEVPAGRGATDRRRWEQRKQAVWLKDLPPSDGSRIQRFVKRQPPQHQPTLLAAIMDYASNVDPTLPTASRKVQYVSDPIELAQIETVLGQIMGSKHKCYVGLQLKSVTRHTVGRNAQLYCFVRGPGACFCMNRAADTRDGAVNFGRVAALTKVADDSRTPGRHTKWTNSVYFVLDWDRRTIRQRCNANSVRSNRRNRFALGASADGGSCKEWRGEGYTLDTDVHRQLFGSLFGHLEAAAVQQLSKRRKVESMVN